jgi:hypothetical protein
VYCKCRLYVKCIDRITKIGRVSLIGIEKPYSCPTRNESPASPVSDLSAWLMQEALPTHNREKRKESHGCLSFEPLEPQQASLKLIYTPKTPSPFTSNQS